MMVRELDSETHCGSTDLLFRSAHRLAPTGRAWRTVLTLQQAPPGLAPVTAPLLLQRSSVADSCPFSHLSLKKDSPSRAARNSSYASELGLFSPRCLAQSVSSADSPVFWCRTPTTRMQILPEQRPWLLASSRRCLRCLEDRAEDLRDAGIIHDGCWDAHCLL